jgi:hypothetical protein
MKATVKELWDTGREIIAWDDSETDRPTSVTDLKKAGNVIVGDRINGPRSPHEVLIDSRVYLVAEGKVRHPAGGGTMAILEVY